jgi:uncharacterized membrane protein
MVLANLTIPMSIWVWVAGGFVVASLALLALTYRRVPGEGIARKIAFGLKLLGIALLACCLIEPLWSGRGAESGANLLLVVADNSGGMNIIDRGETQSRGESLQETIEIGKTGWLTALAENFQVRQYLFDTRLRRTTDFSELVFDGKASSIGMTLRTIAERYRGRPVAGVLLMSDGNATDMTDASIDLSDVPPVYPVAIGRDRPEKDIAVANVSVSQTAFEDAPVTIQADVAAAGYAGRAASVDLTDDTGRLIERQVWNMRGSDERESFRFRLRPDGAGLLFYRVQVTESREDELLETAEATLANNRRFVVVDRGGGPYRILYVSGRPNWEYKFLRRAISEDEQVQLVALLRVARREPKYDWRGRTGESTNPIYRGMEGREIEEAEQYDEPVLVRLNTLDEAELRDGFPTTEAELFGYHAVIFDDVEAEFFTQDQMDLIRRFVSERGGGFLMLGGKESFQNGQFDHTPVSSILPVYLDRLPENPMTGPIRLNLSREGWLEPWARLRDNEQDERQRLMEMPEFRVLNRVGAAKPGARVVATIENDLDEPFPALVAQRLGNGRAAALTVGDVWRWGMRGPEMSEDMGKFWRQTLRWIVADVPQRMALEAAVDSNQGQQAVTLRVRARGEAFEPMDDVSVVVEVRQPQGATIQLSAEPVPSESGLFEATFVPRVSGGYMATATISDAESMQIGRAQAGWTTDLEAKEFASIRTNRALLETIARQTGGRLVSLNDLDDFARSLPHRDVPITSVWVKPVWDLPGLLPAVFLLALACFVGEWALRRWKGMP